MYVCLWRIYVYVYSVSGSAVSKNPYRETDRIDSCMSDPVVYVLLDFPLSYKVSLSLAGPFVDLYLAYPKVRHKTNQPVKAFVFTIPFGGVSCAAPVLPSSYQLFVSLVCLFVRLCWVVRYGVEWKGAPDSKTVEGWNQYAGIFSVAWTRGNLL